MTIDAALHAYVAALDAHADTRPAEGEVFRAVRDESPDATTRAVAARTLDLLVEARATSRSAVHA